jgi:two-component sensor histidine kinase
MPWDLDDLYRMLRASHVQAQGMLDTITDPMLVLDSELTVVSANPAFYSTFETGRDDTIDRPFHELGDGQWDIDDLRHLFEQVIPKAASVSDYEVTAEFPVIGHKTMLVSATRLQQPDSGRRLLLLTIADETERQRESDKKDVVIGELGHRIKNVLAVAQSLARQTRIKDRTAEDYRDDLLGRLNALGKALEVTVAEDKAELPALVRKVLEPYVGDGGRVVLEKGPIVSLTTHQAMGLGMMLHELATNAVKYGALSVSDGRVTIVWNIDDEGDDGSSVSLRWRESNGPKVTPPSSNGFGTRLIQFTAEQDLGGRVERDYQPEGLVVNLTFPLA